MSYTVGQVVFLLLQKELKVIPAMVVEQTVTRTLGGEKTTFSVVVPPTSKNTQAKKYPLDKLNAKVYTAISHARSAMIENATKKINSILAASEELARANFEYSPSEAPALETVPEEILAAEPDSDDVISDIMSMSDTAEIDLGNGIKAKINPKNITLS